MDVFPCDLLWSYTDVYTNVVVVKENINNDKGSTALTKISVFIQQNSMRTQMKDIEMRTFSLYKSFTLRNTSCLQEKQLCVNISLEMKALCPFQFHKQTFCLFWH